MNTQEPCKCPSCSSILVFDIREFALRCPGCNAAYDAEKYEKDCPPKKSPPRKAVPDQEPGRCENCGAAIYPGALALTGTCPCCNGFVRGTSGRRADDVTPDLVIPFLYGRENLLKAFRESCADDPTIRDGFQRNIPPESVRPVYLPFLIHNLSASLDITAIIRKPDGTRTSKGHLDVDGTDFPELLHDLPAKNSSGREPRGISLLDSWESDRAQPYWRAWFCGIRDRYGAASPPEVLDARKSPDFKSIKERILNMGIRRLRGDLGTFKRLLSYDLSITPGSVRYVLCPAWLLPVAFHGKTYLSVMNASTGKTAISVPRSAFKGAAAALGFASFSAGLFALANIPITAPEPPASYAWLTGALILLLYLPSLALMIAIAIKSYQFCCRRLFKGALSVLLISLAVLLAGLLMIYGFFAVYDGPNAIKWGAAFFVAFDVSLVPFFLSKRLQITKRTAAYETQENLKPDDHRRTLQMSLLLRHSGI